MSLFSPACLPLQSFNSGFIQYMPLWESLNFGILGSVGRCVCKPGILGGLKFCRNIKFGVVSTPNLSKLYLQTASSDS